MSNLSFIDSNDGTVDIPTLLKDFDRIINAKKSLERVYSSSMRGDIKIPFEESEVRTLKKTILILNKKCTSMKNNIDYEGCEWLSEKNVKTYEDFSEYVINKRQEFREMLHQEKVEVVIEKPKPLEKSIDSAVVWAVKIGVGTMSVMCFNSACGNIFNGILGCGLFVLFLIICTYKKQFFTNT